MDGIVGNYGEKKDGDESDDEILRTDPGTNSTTPAIPDPSIEMKVDDAKKND